MIAMVRHPRTMPITGTAGHARSSLRYRDTEAPPSSTATEPKPTIHTVRSTWPASGMTKQSRVVATPNPSDAQPKNRAQPMPSAASPPHPDHWLMLRSSQGSGGARSPVVRGTWHSGRHDPHRRNHRVAVLVLEGAKPLDVGIPAQVFTTRASMPYEVRVCGAAPGLGDRRRRPRRTTWPTGSTRSSGPTSSSSPATGIPDRDDPPRAVVDALDRRPRPRARGSPPSRRARSRSPRRACSTAGAPRRTGTTRGRSRRGIRSSGSTRTCCSSTRAACSRRPAPPPASTCACTSCARDHGVAASNHVARRLVAAPYRSGGQAQYVPRSVPEPLGERVRRDARVGAAPARRAAHARRPRPQRERLAAHVLAALRRGHRLHADAVGPARPHRPRPRAARAHRPRRRADRRRVGLGTGANLRLHFHRILGTSPSEYRHTFAEPAGLSGLERRPAGRPSARAQASAACRSETSAACSVRAR